MEVPLNALSISIIRSKVGGPMKWGLDWTYVAQVWS
jgi:hypothetical protein